MLLCGFFKILKNVLWWVKRLCFICMLESCFWCRYSLWDGCFLCLVMSWCDLVGWKGLIFLNILKGVFVSLVCEVWLLWCWVWFCSLVVSLFLGWCSCMIFCGCWMNFFYDVLCVDFLWSFLVFVFWVKCRVLNWFF